MGGGNETNDQSLGSTFCDAIVSNWFWSTANTGCHWATSVVLLLVVK